MPRPTAPSPRPGPSGARALKDGLRPIHRALRSAPGARAGGTAPCTPAAPTTTRDISTTRRYCRSNPRYAHTHAAEALTFLDQALAYVWRETPAAPRRPASYEYLYENSGRHTACCSGAIGRQVSLLLVVTYGLRSCDVPSLKLADIEWRSGQLRVAQCKVRSSLVLPLTPEVNAALFADLRDGRPPLAHREVFLRIPGPAGQRPSRSGKPSTD
jgi:integrase